ncbi:MAG: hypothetical protein IJC30_03895 [Alphaproteobacteria bacterium]|nr:hypothetical protein [Alphaproteobacteria bacterium]
MEKVTMDGTEILKKISTHGCGVFIQSPRRDLTQKDVREMLERNLSGNVEVIKVSSFGEIVDYIPELLRSKQKERE